MLIVGIVTMYHTQAFWGLESNSNACALNTSMNTFYSIGGFAPVIIMIVVIIIAVFLLTSVRAGFG